MRAVSLAVLAGVTFLLFPCYRVNAQSVTLRYGQDSVHH
jgi:hypothetical protein